MPTKYPRSQITKTPELQGALDELKAELGHDISLSVITLAGARTLLNEARAKHELKTKLLKRIRTRTIPVDPNAADEVRRTGWTR